MAQVSSPPLLSGATSITLTLVCAWCKKILRQGTPHAAITHGICPACAHQVLVRQGLA